MARESALLDLSRALAPDTPPDSESAERSLLRAIEMLPRGFKSAAHILILDPSPYKMRARQERAGREFGVSWETFRKRYQDDFLEKIAELLQSGAHGAHGQLSDQPEGDPSPRAALNLGHGTVPTSIDDGWSTKSDPASSLRGLALALSNLADRYADAGRREEAVAAITEAVELYRHLTNFNSDGYEAGLASLLNSLSRHLAGTEQYDEAIAASKEAVELYRGLASQADAHDSRESATKHSLT